MKKLAIIPVAIALAAIPAVSAQAPAAPAASPSAAGNYGTGSQLAQQLQRQG